jgi:WD40 repeat protein
MELKRIDGHTDIKSVAFSRDGTHIISGSYNKVCEWDVLTGVELKELNGHTGIIRSVAFSSDGTCIVSGSDDNSVRVHALMSTELQWLTGHTSVAFSRNGTYIVSGSDDKSVQDASTGMELKRLNGHTHYVTSVAFSSDGTCIVSGSDDKSVQVWDALTGMGISKVPHVFITIHCRT